MKRQLAGLLCMLVAGAGSAQELSGTRAVVLANAAGERVKIASIRFEPAGAQRWRFALTLDEARFEERFLAMRPFRCLTGPAQQLCHFPYGEEREFAAGDFAPLEYALMFLHKKPASVNVDSRNGVYYRMRWDGNRIEGRLHDVDMDPIIVPQGDMRRPIRAEHLLEADQRSHWLPVLSIE